MISLRKVLHLLILIFSINLTVEQITALKNSMGGRKVVLSYQFLVKMLYIEMMLP